MFLRILYRNTGLSRLHSADLTDMRRALVDEDDDGPDGGSPFVQPGKSPAMLGTSSKGVTLSGG
ncbi:MAG: hypothetical protein GJ676_04925 [Rhodobacteraceae bacterium]|nr:hypothetical protein [Paracoccaceae bacterium]